MGNFFGIETPSDKLAIVDADSIIYYVGGACDMLDEGRHFALKMLDQQIEKIYEETACNQMEMYLGTDTNFRLKVATLVGYKSRRDASRRPIYYDALRHRLIHDYNAQLCEQQEAEDVVGIRSFEFNDFNKFVICKIDKDLKMLPGHHYNYRTGKSDSFNKVEALRNFYLQLVTGDMATDSIPGLLHQLEIDKEQELYHKFRYQSRYKSKLIKTLEECNTEAEMYNASFKLYEEYGQIEKHGESRIIEVGRLLWIRRYIGELWLPPTQRDFDYISIDQREDVKYER